MRENLAQFAIALFNRVPLLRRASTQTWLMLTNLVFWVLVLSVIGIIVFFYTLPQLQVENERELKLQAQNLAANLNEVAFSPKDAVCLLVEGAGQTNVLEVYVLAKNKIWCTSKGASLVQTDTSFITLHKKLAYVLNAPKTPFLTVKMPLKEGHTLYLRKGESSLVTLYRKTAWQTFIVAAILLVIFAYWASYVAAHKIIHPIRQMSATARRINEGNIGETIAVDTQAAELQDLAESLNKMAARFKEDIDEWQRVTDMQNEFIGNVSHEVKNPIFSIGGYLEALSSPNLTPEMRQMYVNKGLNNLDRLNNLFSDLIEIARLEYKENVLKPDFFNLQALVDEVAEELDGRAIEKKLQLIADNQPIQVYADRNRIRQVLLNLVGNAIAYTDAGSVECRYRRLQDKVFIEVCDTGRGIAQEHLERIFDRFYRVDKARSRGMGGTGLGLSIVKQILQAHNQDIKVKSTLGEGTCFSFELPLGVPS